MKMYSFKEVERFSVHEKKNYFSEIRRECQSASDTSMPRLCAKLLVKIVPVLHRYKIEIRGEENIPADTSAVFCCNHSNSHDIFTANEVFAKLKRPVSVLVAKDGISLLARWAFCMMNATFLHREHTESKSRAVWTLCNRILHGNDGFVFGEATWNLHPVWPMQKIKTGVVQMAMITARPIIPVIFEYVEVSESCRNESQLYSRCIVTFGKPIHVKIEDSILEQTALVQEAMEILRKDSWKNLGIKRDSLEDIDRQVYQNHLYMKKYKPFGYRYDSEYESKFLLLKENEYINDEYGAFIPGILRK